MSQAERPCLSSSLRFSADLFLDLGSLTNSVSEVVELSSADLTVSYDLYLVNDRRVERENSLDTAAVSNTSYGESLADTAVLLGDNCSLEDLDTALVAFLDLNVNLNGITYVELRNIFLHA